MRKAKKLRVAILLLSIVAMGIGAFQLYISWETQRYADGHGRSQCVAQLIQISSAKEVWARENYKSSGDTPSDEDLFGPERYVREKPVCPSRGIYTIGRVGDQPRCSYPRHTRQ